MTIACGHAGITRTWVVTRGARRCALCSARTDGPTPVGHAATWAPRGMRSAYGMSTRPPTPRWVPRWAQYAASSRATPVSVIARHLLARPRPCPRSSWPRTTPGARPPGRALRQPGRRPHPVAWTPTSSRAPAPTTAPTTDEHQPGVRGHRDVAQPGSAPALGAGGREFESPHPDHAIDTLTCGNVLSASTRTGRGRHVFGLMYQRCIRPAAPYQCCHVSSGVVEGWLVWGGKRPVNQSFANNAAGG